VKYECIKSELKDDYLKRISMVARRLHKKAENDLSFTLMNNLSTTEGDKHAFPCSTKT
jgi:hypothetical protein